MVEAISLISPLPLPALPTLPNWRVSIFISDAVTMDAVTPESSYDAGKAFGDFEARLADIADQLGETIPDNTSMAKFLGAKKKMEDVGKHDFFNPWWTILRDKGQGTLSYKGGWNLFDQIVMSLHLLQSVEVESGDGITSLDCLGKHLTGVYQTQFLVTCHFLEVLIILDIEYLFVYYALRSAKLVQIWGIDLPGRRLFSP